jgi:hypothetical protein
VIEHLFLLFAAVVVFFAGKSAVSVVLGTSAPVVSVFEEASAGGLSWEHLHLLPDLLEWSQYFFLDLQWQWLHLLYLILLSCLRQVLQEW